jgi:DNA-binding NarL/FixJ family response regulator
MLILSGVSDDNAGANALAAGAAGYLIKGNAHEDVIDKILSLAPDRHHY